jgi:hypothetical protein
VQQPLKPKATRKRLKKEILSGDFKKRKMFWKNIAEIFLENFPYGKIFYGKFSTSHHYSCIIWGMNTRPVAGRSSETQSHPVDMNLT